MGTRLRMRMLARSDLFARPALLSLTVDRDGHTVAAGAANAGGFASPQDAHAYVVGNALVARLMRLLGVKVWLWVLEFQTKTGDGWPHWHVLLDLSTCPGGDVDLRRAWSIWRDRWGVGGLDLSRPGKFTDAAHAINYGTKYLIKQPEGGYPVWVLESRKAIRFVGGCKLLGPLVTGDDGPDKSRCKGCGKLADCCVRCGCCRKSCCACPPEPVPPLLDRMARCGLATNVWAETADEDTGEVFTRFAGVLPVGVADACDGCDAKGGSVMTTTDDVGRVSRRVVGQSFAEVFVAVAGHCGLNVSALWSDHWQRVGQRRRKLLNENQFARRLAGVALGVPCGTMPPLLPLDTNRVVV